MNNIVIYSTKPMPELQATLMDIDEADVRVVSIDKMKDYAIINPSLRIQIERYFKVTILEFCIKSISSHIF